MINFSEWVSMQSDEFIVRSASEDIFDKWYHSK